MSSNNSPSSQRTTKTNGKDKLRRTRSLYSSYQSEDFGPKATLKRVNEDNTILIQDPLSQRLSWKAKPTVVLAIKKHCNRSVDEKFCEILEYLINHHNLKIYVEKEEYDDGVINCNKCVMAHLKTSIHLFKGCEESLENKIDLVICLGGDGTLLHVSSLFQKSCPPVLSINLGSLGFLCPFEFENYRTYIDTVLNGNVPILLRNRLSCKLESSSNSQTHNNNNNSVQSETSQTDLKDGYFNLNINDQKRTEWLSLNEIVIDRGSSPYLSNLELYVNDYLITVVQGDGVIISSATGSTAYAMAAGASMCHPSVPALIICPICPHSLSFRPVVVPAGVELRINLSPEARNKASCSVDGRNIGHLTPGESLLITSSEYPLPSICRNNQLNDWFEGLGNCLHWNQRKKQLELDSCYSSTATGEQIGEDTKN